MKHEKTISLSSSTLCCVHLLCCLILFTLPNSTISTTILHSNKTDRITLLDFKNRILEDLAFLPSLSNCTSLQIFSITRNKFGGKLPNTICNLSSQLTYLGLGENKLSGTIPIGIKNLASLIALMLGENLLSGGIPSEIGELKNLQGLGLDGNRFSGEIPLALFNLSSLSYLYMDNNNLDGNIPSNVGNFWNLNELFFSHNKFDGFIPQQVFELPSLSMTLDLSDNSFTGVLSPAVGKLKTLSRLDISGNKLVGEIPESLGDCLSLEYLDLHSNQFEAKIPPLASLKSITHLDISSNKLSGEIPRELQSLTSLQYLNLSFNDLEGEVPTIGIFAKANNISLLGNNKLCGGVLELRLPPCPMKIRKHKKKHLKLLLVIFICFSAVLVFASFLAFLRLRRRKDKMVESTELSKVEKLSKIPYSDLHRATQGFSHTNLIGSGSFGSVYKGRLEQTIAVKVLDLLKDGASTSFHAECEVLRNIRHRNLVPILTCCSSIDFAGHEFKALVYEFMENGDLDTWLHTSPKFLSVIQRLNIAIDVACALHYLHNDCDPVVIHCDLKPSNILLDKDLTAHVGDFGLSRLYSRTIEDSFEEQTSTVGLKGSIGYVPPEYGIGAKASTFGDVYSYGILLLEMFTAKRPTDDECSSSSSSLYEYVEMALPEQVMEIVDPLLLPNNQSNNLVEIEESKMHNFFLSIFKIGLSCASTSPMDRLHMKDVTTELHKIKKGYFVA